MRYKYKVALFVVVFVSCVGISIFLYFNNSAMQSEKSEKNSVQALENDQIEEKNGTRSEVKLVENVQSDSRLEEAANVVKGVFSSPINFRGKVVDLEGNPVPGANVSYSVADKLYASGTNGSDVADEQGEFSINRRGAALTVSVTKEGYYNIPGKSNMTFGYGMGPDSTRKAPPAEGSAATFVLRKRGEAEELVRTKKKTFLVEPNGEAITVNLSKGFTEKVEMDVRSDFDKRGGGWDSKWWFEFSVPGGGIVERKDKFDFIAPQDGYKKSIKVGSDLSKEWQMSSEASYFLKLQDGKYARIDVKFYPGEYRNNFKAELFLNPSGSRNLEFDSSKQINK